jgi:hypothetical protein
VPGVVDENACKSNTVVTFAGGRRLFRFDCHQTSIISEKKLGVPVIGSKEDVIIGVRVERRIKKKIDTRVGKFFDPKAISNYRRS